MVKRKESRYDIIKRLRTEINLLMKRGMIPVHFKNWETIYERYLHNEPKFETKTEAVDVTSIELEVSTKTVERVIKFMTDSE